MSRRPVGLLIVRASVEEGSGEQFRAQVRLTTDTALGFEREELLADAAAIQMIVGQWLEELRSASG